MFRYCTLLILAMTCCVSAMAQDARQAWADSVLRSLTPSQRIAQLMVIRTSSMDAKGQPILFDSLVMEMVKQYNVGAVCLFQGTPGQHAYMLNRMQAAAQTPIMVTVDGEWGLGMRFAGVKNLPYQLTLGAMPNADLVYEVGQAIAEQCRRMNIHVNYAPSVDINNNPANPVIGVRSFGEDKYKVALMGTRIMQGMQDAGVMACAKHFPGHGDVSVDSHYDLPLIEKSMTQLTELELYPFKTLFAQGVGSVMVAHLSIPAIDTTTNQPTSLSYKNITELMRQGMGYQGLTFTDALEMKGVAKFYPGGEAAVQSLMAGNDMLCLPGDVAQTLQAITQAMEQGRLSQATIDEKCRRVLLAKYDYVRGRTGVVGTDHLLDDLNARVAGLRQRVARQALTVLRGDARQSMGITYKTAYIALGTQAPNALSKAMAAAGAKVYTLPAQANAASADSLLRLVQAARPNRVVVGLHGIARSPARQFGYADSVWGLARRLATVSAHSTAIVLGNPYAIGLLADAGHQQLVAAYEDDSTFQQEVAHWLQGSFAAVGKLPVTVGPFAFGQGITATHPLAPRQATGTWAARLSAVDTIAAEAIAQGAAPGCVVAVVKGGELIFQKAYGQLTYDGPEAMKPETIFDLASVTKVTATTLAVMKLYENGQLDLKKKIGEYLPWLVGTDKEGLTVENLLLHQAGLNPFIPFYREADERHAAANPLLWSGSAATGFTTPVAATMYMRNTWVDTMYQRIATSKLVTDKLAFVYSDNDFILLGKIVEAISGMPLHQYVAREYYEPLGLQATGFRAWERFALNQIAPTEAEKTFRKQLIWGYVHDPGAAMFGNVAGHAGLFGTAADLATVYQMLLNGGHLGGRQYLHKATIDLFTSYQTPISHRGLGFDKPHKNNAIRPEGRKYPASYVSPATFGHTGFTGTCVWADPQQQLIFIFLSNRVHPDGNRKLLDLNIRPRIHDVVYQALTR